MRNQDLTSTCLEEGVALTDLRSVFCVRCRNSVCGYAQAPPASQTWEQRMETQVDRLLLNPTFAKEGDEAFEVAKRLTFPSTLQESITVAKARSQGQWSVPPAAGTRLAGPAPKGFDAAPEAEPTEAPATQPAGAQAPPETYKVVERVSNRDVVVTETQPAIPQPVIPAVVSGLKPPAPQDGKIIGAPIAPSPKSSWTVGSAPRDVVIPVGGKVRFD